MSIIHDALKKVQQGLSSNKGETPVNPSATPPQEARSPWAKAPEVETLPQADQQHIDQKPAIKHKIKSILALSLALTITVGSSAYIYKQFQNNIPRVQRLAKASFYKLINKKEEPEFKTKAPEDLKPLAKITINPAGSTATAASIAKPVPTTLNIHGIMSNSTGGNLVLINDSVYQEGDEVDGAKILKINLDSITVNNNGVEQTISVRN